MIGFVVLLLSSKPVWTQPSYDMGSGHMSERVMSILSRRNFLND